MSFTKLLRELKSPVWMELTRGSDAPAKAEPPTVVLAPEFKVPLVEPDTLDPLVDDPELGELDCTEPEGLLEVEPDKPDDDPLERIEPLLEPETPLVAPERSVLPDGLPAVESFMEAEPVPVTPVSELL